MTPPRTCPALLSAASVVFEGRADRCGQTVDVHRVSGGLVFRQFAPQLLPINVRYFEIDDHVIPSLCYVSLGQCQPGREGRVERIARANIGDLPTAKPKREQLLVRNNLCRKQSSSSDNCVPAVFREMGPFSNHSDGQHHGGIFNFDFSTDGRVLVAACEKRSFLVFDPFNGKLVQTKNGAHMNCVNCVKFLDTRTFATCSDDNTVALWDLRFLGSKVRSLHGHSYWVKNIEYAASRGLLVTSGFDGTIYTWDINNYSNEDGCRRVFYTDGLMRSKLTHDDSKLVVATADGYLIIIHNLDLEHLDTDTADFKLHFTESMQETGTSIIDSNIKRMFERSRNRVELLSDFPKGDKALVITSLQVHPQGWCVSSRNTSSDESSEWTCVHDISEDPQSPSFLSNTRRSRRHLTPMSAPERQQPERVDRGRPGQVEQDVSLVHERLVEPQQSEESGVQTM
ncbi:hypothetical protein C0Q70_09365 [Pomacea canaliculata]|uniref:Uncharacterized protein n=1 Tax=Pomacea canaliculata TaxID=400727 RepID=A0A2T7P9L2_POMCA|nr:hypothetical protein C0Q70_09365 [Pomacea canaliculata]